MTTTLTALWKNDPQQFLDWICKIKVGCFYDVNKICDWLRREKNISEPTEHELQSMGYLMAAESMADLCNVPMFDEPRTTSSFAPLSSASLPPFDTPMSELAATSTAQHQQPPNTSIPVTTASPAPTTKPAVRPPRSSAGPVSRPSSKAHASTVTLDHLVIELKVFHEAVLPFAEGELRQMIGEFVLRHTRKRMDMLHAQQSSYQLIEPININDEFGGWTFDVLFGMLQVTLKRENDAPFPLCWSTQRDRTTFSVIVTRGEEHQQHEVSLNHPSLEEWLQQLCDKTKMSHHYEEWLNLLREAHVDRLQHLLDWTSERWKALKMPPNALEIIQRAMTEFRYQDAAKPSNKVSEAELIANVHRIKLYFYYHLGRAGELGYLNADAVKLAFEEVAKAGYEAADLSERIKALLYSETMPAEEPKKEDQRDAERTKQLLQLEITSVEAKIDQLKKQEDEYEAAGKTEIERQLRSDEQLATIAKELNFLKSELKEHLLQGNTSKLALHRQGRLEGQIRDAEREFELYKKATVVRILRSPTCKNYRQLRRDIKADVAKLKSHLDSLKNLRNSKPKSRSDILKHYRGIIFYGPPGTGKTRMMNEIQKRVGFTSVVLPLAAAEVNRSLVGQTEKLILDICNRARLLPHLLCVVSIDEIDALAPKRDEKVSQHKLDSLSVLLSVIEGIKDVPNLIMLAATNRIKMMDEAFLRRMSGQFFVGRPSALVRRRLLGDLNQLGVRLLDEDVMDFALLLTTNFTGAAIVQLRSNLLVYSYMHRLDKLSKEHVVDQCRVAARQFSISVGGYTLPDLLVNWQPETQLSLTEGDFTGRVHVDLQQKVFQIEIKDADYSTVVPLSSSNRKTFLNSILPYLVQFALDRNIDFVQVFDSSWIVSNAAYDDHKIMEVLSERINECREYKRAMMIFDLDSLVGVNDNQSVSSMGLSTSNSVNNQRLFSYLVDIAKEAKVQGDEEQWVVTTALHPYLSKTFKASVLFSPTDDETTKERQEYERNNLHLTCQNCNLTYVEVENKLNCCSYHDGFLMDMALSARDLSPLSEDNVMLSADSSKVLWICCGRNMRDGGCKNNKHQPSATGQQDKIGKHARALHLYREKFEKFKAMLIEKQDRAKPRK